LKKTVQLLIGLALAAGALYYTLHNVAMDELVKTFQSLDYFYALPTLGIMTLSYLLRAFRWRILLAPMKQVRAGELFSPLMVGFMGNILPGRAGEFFRAYLLGQKHGISFSGAFATIVVERLFDLAVLLLLFVWVFVFRAQALDASAQFSGVSVQTLAYRFGQISLVLVLGLVGFLYLLVAHQERMMGVVRWCIRPLPSRWHRKIEYLIHEFSLGLMVVKNFNALCKIAIYSFLVWLAIIYSLYPLYLAYDVGNKSLESLVVVNLMVAICITVLPTPAMLGSFNAGVLIGLSKIMGEKELTAVSLSMVAWALNFAVVLGLGIYFILHDHLSIQKLVEAEERAETQHEEDERHYGD